MDEIKLYEYDYSKPDLLDDEILEHHGIKGQKWGVRNGPPYPLKRGVSNGEALIGSSSRSGGKVSKRKARKTYKKRVKTLKKARKAAAEKRAQQQEVKKTKEEILASKDLTEIFKNKDLFTTKELQDINLRQAQLQNLKSYAKAQADARRTPVEKAKDTIKDAVKQGASAAVTNMLKQAAQAGTRIAIQKVATELSSSASPEAKRVIDQMLGIQRQQQQQQQQNNKKKKKK